MSSFAGARDDAIDQVTLEVVRNKLDGIANEMQVALVRSAFSPIVKEGLDASASLFTIEGETLSQAIAIPIHLSTLIPIVQTIRRTFPVETMRDGDIYIMNDPYLGGTHLPDIALVKPLFADGVPIAFSASMTHHQDVGGMSPGSVPTTATEIFQEGVRIPPLKFHDAGAENETLVGLLRQNVRLPESFFGDLNAQVAACQVGERRIRELATSLGGNAFRAISASLLDRAEALTEAAIQRMPEGTYSYEGLLDNDGVELNKPVRIAVAVTLRDGKMHCDFAGTDPQVKGPFNCVPSGSHAAAYFAVRAVTDPEIPTNGGCFRPVTLDLPEGSLVNPRPPAPVNSRTATIKRITGCLLGALREAAPEKIGADGSCAHHVLMFGGMRPDGRSYVVGEMLAAGSGAGTESDGVDVIETDATNCMNLPVEAMELDVPIRVNRTALRADSGGAGRQRGGLGMVREYEILAGDVRVTHRGERYFHQAPGAEGGSAGASAVTRIIRADGAEEFVPSKQMLTLSAGDRMIVETAGGGGYGDPETRDPGVAGIDRADGKVTV
jgi:N-methylhydantoinase B